MHAWIVSVWDVGKCDHGSQYLLKKKPKGVLGIEKEGAETRTLGSYFPEKKSMTVVK